MKTDLKNGFTIQIEQSHDYDILTIQLLDLSKYDRPSIAFRFQSTTRENRLNYYGGRMDDVTCKTMEQFNAVHSLLKRVMKPKPGFESWSLGSFESLTVMIENLIRSKIPQVVYDYRTSQHVKLEDLAPENVFAYRDDWEAVKYADNETGCTVACMASSDEEAKRLLTLKFAERTGNHDTKRMEQWLAAGRPVMRLTHHFEHPSKVRPGLILTKSAAELLAEIKTSMEPKQDLVAA